MSNVYITDYLTFHGLFATTGIFVGILITYFLSSNRLDFSKIPEILLFSSFFGVIGAKICYLIVYKDQFNSFSEMLDFNNGGMVSYGGFVFGLLAYIFFLKRHKKPILKWLDITSCGFFAGLFLGRVGDVISKDFSGYVNISINNPYIKIVPVPALEAIVCGILTLTIFIWYYKNNLLTKLSGTIVFSSFLVYGICRFVIDFWRTEDKIIFSISLGQCFSLLLFIFSLYCLFAVGKRNRSCYGK